MEMNLKQINCQIKPLSYKNCSLSLIFEKFSTVMFILSFLIDKIVFFLRKKKIILIQQ